KLRSLTDPTLSESGIRGNTAATGAVSRLRTEGPRPTGPAAPEKMTYQQKVNSFVNSTMDIMAQTATDPVTGKQGVKLNPVFLNTNKTPAAPATNPLIPGGY